MDNEKSIMVSILLLSIGITLSVYTFTYESNDEYKMITEMINEYPDYYLKVNQDSIYIIDPKSQDTIRSEKVNWEHVEEFSKKH